jgi:hypothetical protein
MGKGHRAQVRTRASLTKADMIMPSANMRFPAIDSVRDIVPGQHDAASCMVGIPARIPPTSAYTLPTKTKRNFSSGSL